MAGNHGLFVRWNDRQRPFCRADPSAIFAIGPQTVFYLRETLGQKFFVRAAGPALLRQQHILHVEGLQLRRMADSINCAMRCAARFVARLKKCKLDGG